MTKDARDRANRPGDETGLIKLLSKNSRTGTSMMTLLPVLFDLRHGSSKGLCRTSGAGDLPPC